MKPLPNSIANLSGRRVLVTGATGFLGSHLVRRLVQEGAIVSALGRGRGPMDRLADVRGEIERYQIDLEDAQALESLARRVRPEYVFHLAGRVDPSRSAEITEACLRENVLATANLLWALQDIPIQAFVFTSTTEVYGHNPVPFHEDQVVDPPSPYAVSKVAAEHLCRFFATAYSCPVVILRLSTVYGPQQNDERLIPSTILAILRGTPLSVTDGEHRRNFLYVDDAIEGIVKAATRPTARGETINLGGESVVSLREVIDTIRRLMGTTWEPVYGVRERRINEPLVMRTNREKAKRLLGWEPTIGLEEGLRVTIEAYRMLASPSGVLSG